MHDDTDGARALHAQFEHAEYEAWAEIQRDVSAAFRDRFGIRVHHIDGAVVLVAPHTDMLAMNRAWLPGSAPSLGTAMLDGVIALFRDAGAERFVIHWPPESLPLEAPEWFLTRGFKAGHSMMKLCRRSSMTLTSASDFEIVESGSAEAGQFGIVAALGNELPEFMAPGFTSTVGRSGWRHYFAMENGIPVATAASRADGDVAWFGFAGTLPSHRGRGAQSALLARRIRDAASDGCGWVTCETMADTAERPSRSFRNMMRLGFMVAYPRANFILALR